MPESNQRGGRRELEPDAMMIQSFFDGVMMAESDVPENPSNDDTLGSCEEVDSIRVQGDEENQARDHHEAADSSAQAEISRQSPSLRNDSSSNNDNRLVGEHENVSNGNHNPSADNDPCECLRLFAFIFFCTIILPASMLVVICVSVPVFLLFGLLSALCYYGCTSHSTSPCTLWASFWQVEENLMASTVHGGSGGGNNISKPSLSRSELKEFLVLRVLEKIQSTKEEPSLSEGDIEAPIEPVPADIESESNEGSLWIHASQRGSLYFVPAPASEDNDDDLHASSSSPLASEDAANDVEADDDEDRGRELQLQEQKHDSSVVGLCCDICMEEYRLRDRVAWSPNPLCRHHYHQDCILDWLENDNTTCPFCRHNYLVGPSTEKSVEKEEEDPKPTEDAQAA